MLAITYPLWPAASTGGQMAMRLAGALIPVGQIGGNGRSVALS